MKLLRGLPRGEAMGEAPGMRCTRFSYLVLNTSLSSCRVLTSCEVNPKPAYIQPTSVTADHLDERGNEVASLELGKRKQRESMRDVLSSRDLIIPSALLKRPLSSSLDFSNNQLLGPGPSPPFPPLLASSSWEVTGKGDPNTESDALWYGGGGEPEEALPRGETLVEA